MLFRRVPRRHALGFLVATYARNLVLTLTISSKRWFDIIMASDSHLRKRTVEAQPNQGLETQEEEEETPKSRLWLKWGIERTDWDILLASTALKFCLYPA